VIKRWRIASRFHLHLAATGKLPTGLWPVSSFCMPDLLRSIFENKKSPGLLRGFVSKNVRRITF
jgi:hypothetical protein